LNLLIRKQLASPICRYRLFGIVGSITVIKHLNDEYGLEGSSGAIAGES
jgi:hypothetical protein